MKILHWNKTDIENITPELFDNWYDVYNYGLIEDRGYTPNSLSKEAQVKISEAIKQDYYNYLDNLDDNFKFYKIIVENGKFVAMGRIVTKKNKYYIEGLETHRDFRQRGYGKVVLKSLITSLFDLGINKVYSTIRKTNIPSIKTHESVGFIRDEESEINYTYIHKR